MMVGRTVDTLFPAPRPAPGAVVLDVRHLTVEDPHAHAPSGERRWPVGRRSHARLLVDDVSFSVRAGEVLGIGGLIGAGRTELLLALFGAAPGRQRGRSWWQACRSRSAARPRRWRTVSRCSARTARGSGCSRISRSPRIMCSPRSADFPWPRHVARPRTGRGRAHRSRASHQASCASRPAAGNLSGGNQQKVLLGRWLLTGPRVLLLDEPTRGVDVGRARKSTREIDRLAREGLAIVVVSSDLPELIGLSDRVLVLRGGRLAATFDRDAITPEAVMAAAALRGAVDLVCIVHRSILHRLHSAFCIVHRALCIVRTHVSPPRHRRRHRRHARDRDRRGRAHHRVGDRRARPVRLAADRVGRTGSARLVARDLRRRARGAGRGAADGRRHHGGRLLRPDARVRAARRPRRGDPPGAHLVRPADRGAVPRHHRDGRRGAADRADVQPGAHRLHAAEAAVGARARAAGVGTRHGRAAAEGLRAVPAHRRSRDRRRGCVGHAAVRRRRPPVVGRHARRDGARRRHPAARVRIAGGHRHGVHRRRRGDRPPPGHTRRGGRRRSGRGRRRHGDRARGRGERHHRHVGRRLCRHRQARARSAGPRAHVLSRGAGPLAHHGRDAGRGAVAAMVPRSVRRGLPRTAAIRTNG